jgi:hypothetical protein
LPSTAHNSVEYKRRVVQQFLGGESPHALAIGRNLIKIWIANTMPAGSTAATKWQYEGSVRVARAAYLTYFRITFTAAYMPHPQRRADLPPVI